MGLTSTRGNRCRTRAAIRKDWGGGTRGAATVPARVDDIVKTAVISEDGGEVAPRRAGQRLRPSYAPELIQVAAVAVCPLEALMTTTRIIPAQQNATRFRRGFEPYDIPDYLFGFQRYLVDWAIRQGRGALFADCGMGRTPMGVGGGADVHKHRQTSY